MKTIGAFLAAAALSLSALPTQANVPEDSVYLQTGTFDSAFVGRVESINWEGNTAKVTLQVKQEKNQKNQGRILELEESEGIFDWEGAPVDVSKIDKRDRLLVYLKSPPGPGPIQSENIEQIVVNPTYKDDYYDAGWYDYGWYEDDWYDDDWAYESAWDWGL